MAQYECYVLGCKEPPIRSHSLSKESMLRQISVDGHVDSIIMSEGRKQGIGDKNKNDAIRSLFCKKHDDLFQPIDNISWTKDPIEDRHFFLIAMRCAAKEWFQQLNVAIPAQRAMNSFEHSPIQFPSEEVDATEQDIRKFRKFFTDNVQAGRYKSMQGSLIKVSGSAKAAYSSPMLLEQGPEGIINDLIHSVDKKIKIAPLYVTFFPVSEQEAFLFLCYKKTQKSKYSFIDTKWEKFNNLEKINLVNSLLVLYGENLFTAPNFLNQQEIVACNRIKIAEYRSAQLTQSPDTFRSPVSFFE